MGAHQCKEGMIYYNSTPNWYKPNLVRETVWKVPFIITRTFESLPEFDYKFRVGFWGLFFSIKISQSLYLNPDQKVEDSTSWTNYGRRDRYV